MLKDNSKEIFPVVDECGNVVGKATRGECHGGGKLLHPVVHLHVFDEEGRLFFAAKAVVEGYSARKWDTAVGGHVDYGEEVADALTREAFEEIGIEKFQPEFLKAYVFESEGSGNLCMCLRQRQTLLRLNRLPNLMAEDSGHAKRFLTR